MLAKLQVYMFIGCLFINSHVNSKPVDHFSFCKVRRTKLPVIENIIILGFLLVATSLKQYKTYIFREIAYFLYFLFIVNEAYRL